MSLVSGRSGCCGGGTSIMVGFIGRVAARLRCLYFDKCVGHLDFIILLVSYVVILIFKICGYVRRSKKREC